MTEKELGGNIILVNFDLDNQEMIIAKKIIGNYAKKIRNFAEYNELKIELKIHKKPHAGAKYEVKANLLLKIGRADTETEGFNPFVTLNTALSKILAEVQHKNKKW